MQFPKELQHVILDYLSIEHFLSQDLDSMFPDYIRSVPLDRDCDLLYMQSAAKCERFIIMQDLSHRCRHIYPSHYPRVTFALEVVGSLALYVTLEGLTTIVHPERSVYWPDAFSYLWFLFGCLAFVPLYQVTLNIIDSWTRKKLKEIITREDSDFECIRKIRRGINYSENHQSGRMK